MTEEYKGFTIDVGTDPPTINRVLRNLVDDIVARADARRAKHWTIPQNGSGGGLGTGEWPLIASPVSITAPFGAGVPYVVTAMMKVAATMPAGFGYYACLRKDGSNVDLMKHFNMHATAALQVPTQLAKSWLITDNLAHTYTAIFQSPETTGANLSAGSGMTIVAMPAVAG